MRNQLWQKREDGTMDLIEDVEVPDALVDDLSAEQAAPIERQSLVARVKSWFGF